MKSIDIFNTREIAIVVWVMALIIFFIPLRVIRKSSYSIFKALFDYKILILFIFMIGYISIVVSILSVFGWWSASLLKETIVWIFMTAFVLVINSVNVKKQKDLFQNAIIDSFKIIVIIQFIADSYTFSFVVEFLLVPIVFLMALLEIFTRDREEYRNVNRVMIFLLMIFGILVIMNSINFIIIDPNRFRTCENVNKFWLPIKLTILYLPFVYMVSLISNYEVLFFRLKIGENKSKKVIRYAKYRILLYCKLSFRRQHEIMNMGLFNIMNIKTKEDVDDMIKCYRQSI